MKRFKRITAFFLAAVMILAMGSTAFAAGKAPEFPEGRPASSSADISKHEFTAYQIFKGKVDNKTLSEIDWGEGINAEEFIGKLKVNDKFGGAGDQNIFYAVSYDKDATYKSADAVANIIQSWTGDKLINSEWQKDEKAREFARLADSCKKTGSGIKKDGKLSAGYYLIVDTEIFADGTENAVRNLSFLQLASDNETFDPSNKTDVPEIDKKVKEVNDSNDTSEWKDVADSDIGDEVEFVLTGTLPADYDSYDKYTYIFHDTLSGGLQLNKESVKIYINDKEVHNGFKIDTANIGSESLRITFEDLKTIKEEVVTVESLIRVKYTATLSGENVVYGGAGNQNKVYLEYSNNPNATDDGDRTTGKTPEETVVVFTYQSIVNKTDENGEPLKGAGFTLYKYIEADEAADETTEETTEDVVVDKYKPVGEEIKGEDLVKFEFKGIDAGRYKLVETTVPANYNKVEDLYFEVERTFDETKKELTKLEVKKVYYNKNPEGQEIELEEIKDEDGKAVFRIEGNVSDGSLSASIVNKKGFLFPATGGIGTTIFYVIGGILIAGAGVLLIVKKRADKSE